MSEYKSEGCEHCNGVYGIEIAEGVFECPMCGAETIMDARDSISELQQIGEVRKNEKNI